MPWVFRHSVLHSLHQPATPMETAWRILLCCLVLTLKYTQWLCCCGMFSTKLHKSLPNLSVGLKVLFSRALASSSTSSFRFREVCCQRVGTCAYAWWCTGVLLMVFVVIFSVSSYNNFTIFMLVGCDATRHTRKVYLLRDISMLV